MAEAVKAFEDGGEMARRGEARRGEARRGDGGDGGDDGGVARRGEARVMASWVRRVEFLNSYSAPISEGAARGRSFGAKSVSFFKR